MTPTICYWELTQDALVAVIVGLDVQIIEGALHLLGEVCLEPGGLLGLLLLLLPLLLVHRVQLQLHPAEQRLGRVRHLSQAAGCCC